MTAFQRVSLLKSFDRQGMLCSVGHVQLAAKIFIPMQSRRNATRVSVKRTIVGRSPG